MIRGKNANSRTDRMIFRDGAVASEQESFEGYRYFNDRFGSFARSMCPRHAKTIKVRPATRAVATAIDIYLGNFQVCREFDKSVVREEGKWARPFSPSEFICESAWTWQITFFVSRIRFRTYNHLQRSNTTSSRNPSDNETQLFFFLKIKIEI